MVWPKQPLQWTGPAVRVIMVSSWVGRKPGFGVIQVCLHGDQTVHAKYSVSLILGILVAPSPWLHAQSDLQRNLKDTNVGKHWIYNDLKDGFAHAKATGKPLLVVFRCVP